jgi:hypothetical protein
LELAAAEAEVEVEPPEPPTPPSSLDGVDVKSDMDNPPEIEVDNPLLLGIL